MIEEAGSSGWRGAAGILPADVAGYRLALAPDTSFQGTGLPIAGRFVDAQSVIDVPTMLVQPLLGDKARRPPA